MTCKATVGFLSHIGARIIVDIMLVLFDPVVDLVLTIFSHVTDG